MTDNINSECKKCGAKIPSNINFCPECGAEIGENPIVCPVCGNAVESAYCPHCGHKMGEDSNKTNAKGSIFKDKKNIVILVLCVLVVVLVCVIFAINSNSFNSSSNVNQISATEPDESDVNVDNSSESSSEIDDVKYAEELFEFEDSAYKMVGDDTCNICVKVRNITGMTFKDVMFDVSDLDSNGDVLSSSFFGDNEAFLKPDQAGWYEHQDEYGRDSDSIKSLAEKYSFIEINSVSVTDKNNPDDWETISFKNPVKIKISNLKEIK